MPLLLYYYIGNKPLTAPLARRDLANEILFSCFTGKYRRERGNTVIHRYKNNGYNIVLDVNSGSVHVVDELVYDIIGLLSGKTGK